MDNRAKIALQKSKMAAMDHPRNETKVQLGWSPSVEWYFTPPHVLEN